ncbi:hypothetical protein ZIOFF_019714 [Zingiber officinale]|uniref:Uncharacterized protein n=1 Tax=Zingiber officinale TaxID=94328 RepID=A0A8J5HMA6_ZINOF|nr:hypothetical protein ZIOFF_019714 [Zingiber officinale]
MPDHVTFVGVFTACSHAGLIHKGCYIFNALFEVYSCEPQAEHYACMVDLFARWGLLEEAEAVVLVLPTSPNINLWGALLAACKRHKNLVMAKRISEQLYVSEPLILPIMFSSQTYDVFFVDGGGCAMVLPQQAFRQGARLRLAIFRPPPHNPVHPQDLVQQGRTFAPSSLLSITLADPFPYLLILQIDVARWSHPHRSPVFSLKVETLKI